LSIFHFLLALHALQILSVLPIYFATSSYSLSFQIHFPLDETHCYFESMLLTEWKMEQKSAQNAQLNMQQLHWERGGGISPIPSISFSKFRLKDENR
jgi:hypothetical protein